LRRLTVPIAKMFIGSAVMTAAILTVRHFLALPPVVLLAVSIAVGGVAYFASMAAMGMKGIRRKPFSR
jgi:hypothetical protein